MSAAHDRKFTDMFTLVVGILAGIAFGIYFLASYVAGRTQESQVRDDAAFQQEVAERIAPVGKVAIAGKDNSAFEVIPAATAAAVAPAVSTEVLSGEQVYQMACVICHGAGVAGAPKFADKVAWAPHVAKGTETLHKNALTGVQGTAGVMPAKGGRVDLSDQSVLNGVDYMVNAAK